MSSLVPGSLFYSTGLNKKHTPTPPTISNDELDRRYAREPFNGRPWPPSSPVSGVYDIRNTSTKLILINNRKKKESQLRGKNNPRKEEHRYPEPERHSRCSTPVNKELHSRCLDSSSPYYEPEIDLEMDWLNRSQRPPNRFAAGSAVNPKRHTSCQVPSNPRAFDIRLHSATNRPTSRTSLPASFGKGSLMGYKDLTPGEQRYFASITRIYSCNQMVRLKRRQYIDLLNQELSKGLYTKKEYERYRDYIALGRQRQYIQTRAMSAPVRGRSYHGGETDRSISSISGDDKSNVSEKQENSSEKSTERRQETKRSSTPDKRPLSVKSNSSKKTASSENTSPDKNSRSSSAKSTNSDQKVLEKNKTKEQENDKDEGTDQQTKANPLPQDNAESKKGELKPSKAEHDESEHKPPTHEAHAFEHTILKREVEASDSDSNVPSGKQYSAREGHDRPKSRLGHIPEDTDDQKEDAKKEQKYQEDNSLSNKSIDDLKREENTTQNKNDTEKQNTRNVDESTDDNSSDEEEKDPDKLQY